MKELKKWDFSRVTSPQTWMLQPREVFIALVLWIIVSFSALTDGNPKVLFTFVVIGILITLYMLCKICKAEDCVENNVGKVYFFPFEKEAKEGLLILKELDGTESIIRVRDFIHLKFSTVKGTKDEEKLSEKEIVSEEQCIFQAYEDAKWYWIPTNSLQPQCLGDKLNKWAFSDKIDDKEIIKIRDNDVFRVLDKEEIYTEVYIPLEKDDKTFLQEREIILNTNQKFIEPESYLLYKENGRYQLLSVIQTNLYRYAFVKIAVPVIVYMHKGVSHVLHNESNNGENLYYEVQRFKNNGLRHQTDEIVQMPLGYYQTYRYSHQKKIFVPEKSGAWTSAEIKEDRIIFR